MRRNRKKLDLSLLILSFSLCLTIVVGVTGAWLSDYIENAAGSETFGVVSIGNIGTGAQIYQTGEVNLDGYLMPGDEMTIELDIENDSNVKILLRARLDMSSDSYGQGNQDFDNAFSAVRNAFRTELASMLSDWHLNIADGFFYLMPGGQLHYDATSGNYYALDGGFTSLSTNFFIPTGSDYPEINFNVLQGETVTFSFVIEAVQAANQYVGISNNEPWLAGGWGIAGIESVSHTFGVYGIDVDNDYLAVDTGGAYSHPETTEAFILSDDFIFVDNVHLSFEITNDYSEDVYLFITPTFDIVDSEGLSESINYGNTNVSNLTELNDQLIEAMVDQLKSGWTYASETVINDVDFLGADYLHSHEKGFFLDAIEITNSGQPLSFEGSEIFETSFVFSPDLKDDLVYIYLTEELFISISFGVSIVELSDTDFNLFTEDTSSSVSANAQLAFYAFSIVIQGE